MEIFASDYYRSHHIIHISASSLSLVKLKKKAWWWLFASERKFKDPIGRFNSWWWLFASK